MVSYAGLKSSVVLRFSELKGCGANKPGGGGFSAGNTCAKGGNQETGPLSEDEKNLALSKLNELKKLDESNYEKIFGPTNNVSAADVFTANKATAALIGISDRESKKYGTEKVVTLSTLTAGQEHIPREGLRAYIKEMPQSDRLPEVVKLRGDSKGRTVIISGHTRLGVQALAGRTHAKVLYYTLDKNTGKLVKE